MNHLHVHLKHWKITLLFSTVHRNENPIYVFPEKELRGLSLWAIYIFPEFVHIFSWSRIGRPILGMYKSLIHECGNWDWGRSIPFLGIFVSNFRYKCLCSVCTSYSKGYVFSTQKLPQKTSICKIRSWIVR